MLIVEIAGLERLIFPTSLQIDETANGRNTASMLVQSTSGGATPQVGQSVRIKWDETVIFAGTVDSIDEDNPNGTTLVNRSLKCVDYNQLADRPIVASSFDSETFQSIVNDLLVNYLAADGVVAGNIPTGSTITRMVFPYKSVAECFNDLAQMTGYTWNIDYSKALNFCPIGTFSAPIDISQGSGLYRNPKVRRSRDQYKNSMILAGGRDTSDARTESFKGNGTDRNFIVSLAIAKEPTITVNSTPRTVGIKGVETGFDFYWNQDDPIIQQDAGATALTSSDTLAVTYQGYFPIVLQLEDNAQIEQRQSVEGGTGRYGYMESDQSIDSNQLAIDKILGTLRRFGFIPTQFSFETDTNLTDLAAQLRAGQTISVDMPIHDISDTFFIQGLSTRFDGVRLIVNAKCIDAEKSESWADFIGKLFAAGRKTTLREGTALSIVRTISGDEIAVTDSLTPTSGAVESRIGTAIIGFSEVAA